MSDRVCIGGLEVGCVVGIYPEEREQEQPLVIDIEISADLRRAGRSGHIRYTCDYATVAREVGALLRFREYKLLEAAAEELAAMLLGVHVVADAVQVRIEKPKALASLGAKASVQVARVQSDYPRRFESPAWGSVEVVLETNEAGLYLLNVDPGCEIPRHHHARMRELEWLVSGELSRQGSAIPLAEPVSWELGQSHAYSNASERTATLFCCDTPPFIPEDEVVE